MFFGYPETPTTSPYKAGAFQPDTPPPRVSFLNARDTSWLGITTSPVAPQAATSDVAPRSNDVSFTDAHSFAQCPVHSREIVHLRLRLVYLDELLARKSIDLDLAAESSSSRALCEMLRADNASLQHRVSELEAQLRASEKAQAEAQVKIQDIEMNLEHRPTLRDLEKVRDVSDALQRELETTEAKLASLHEEYTLLNVSFKASRSEAAAAIEATRSEMEAMVEAEHRRGLEAVADVSRQRDGLREMIEAHDKERIALRGEGQVRDEALREARALLSSSDAMIKDLTQRHDVLHAEMLAVKASNDTLARDKSSLEFAVSRFVTACSSLDRDLMAMSARAAPTTGPTFSTLSIAAVINAPPHELDSTLTAWSKRCIGLASQAGMEAADSLAAGIKVAVQEGLCAPIERHLRSSLHRLSTVSISADTAKQRILRRVTLLKRRVETAEVHTAEVRERMEADSAARLAENASLIADIGARMQHTVEDRVRTGLAEIRSNIINTNVLTRDFVDRVETVVNRAVNVVRDMHDRQDAYPRPPALLSAAQQTSRSPSPDVIRSTSASQMSTNGYLASAELLAQQCGNIATLLRTNLAQADDQERRFANLLSKLRESIASDLSELQQKLSASSRSYSAAATMQLARQSSLVKGREYHSEHSSLLPSPHQRSPVQSATNRLF